MGGAACKDALLQLCARPLQTWLDADRQRDAGLGQGTVSRELWDHCGAVLATMHKQQPSRLPHLSPLGLQTVCGGQQVMLGLAAVAAGGGLFLHQQLY